MQLLFQENCFLWDLLGLFLFVTVNFMDASCNQHIFMVFFSGCYFVLRINEANAFGNNRIYCVSGLLLESLFNVFPGEFILFSGETLIHVLSHIIVRS